MMRVPSVALDRNVARPTDAAPLWSETRWVGCWSPTADVGIYVHAGRFRRDLEMWWAQVGAYLPGRELCVDRFWGRNGSDAGVRFGGLDLEMSERGWRCTFDGVGELTSVAALAREVRGASAPSRSMSFALTATAAAPVWDMYADSAGARESHASDMHIQQAYATHGALVVDGFERALDGIGFKDHSSGARDFRLWHGHRFLLIVTPEWSAHLLSLENPDRSPQTPWGVFFRDGRHQSITAFSLPPMTDAEGGPVDGELTFATSGGETFAFQFELVHGLPITITDANDNINGVDWSLSDGGAEDPALFVEGNARLTGPDGTVVYAYVERGAHQSAIARPD
jgi:hypothetical protein